MDNSQESLKKKWTCNPCGRTMNLQDKEAHLNGKAHRGAGQASQRPKKPAPARPKKPERLAFASKEQFEQGGVQIQVKNAQRVCGHLCEIPVAAYAEADVAYSRSDWVTIDDVDRASDAWDARSIAHEIDTQWGDMPCGGAYKDSNIYFGPGDYDFY
eukprot:gene4369-14493_t